MIADLPRLTSTLRAAREAADAAASAVGDGGSANMDAAFLCDDRKSNAVAGAIAAAGLSARWWRTRYWRGWMLSLSYGMGGKQTAGCEAFVRVLREAGFNAAVYYHVD